MKILCISQARMGSSRLPGKVLKRINDKTLLQYHCERIAQVKNITQHIIATTNLPQDTEIVDFCSEHNIPYFCGDEKNVLSRYYHTALAFDAQPADLIIRVTSDCPLIAPDLVDQLINKHITTNMSGISNIDITTYPRGMDAEIFTMAALTNSFTNANTSHHKEHVTPYLYQNSKQYRTYNLINPNNQSFESKINLRLCVDEEDDFILIKALINAYPDDITSATAREIMDFLLQQPAIAKINQHIQQKTH